jgi:hypothetical protein
MLSGAIERVQGATTSFAKGLPPDRPFFRALERVDGVTARFVGDSLAAIAGVRATTSRWSSRRSGTKHSHEALGSKSLRLCSLARRLRFGVHGGREAEGAV